ncbi:MAG: alpha/beta fold hydrolase [Anaerolineae bacterium]|nr:alpha/beta fold hydrolase [Anaerolineae bacterium]
MAQPSEPVTLFYKESGQGLPVVLLHGFPFDQCIWQAQRDVLSDTFRVITPDLRGHGQSPAPDGTYYMDVLAGDVIALLDSLGIERAVWVGHSMGGYVVMAALRTAPERVMGVGLVATHPYADTAEKRLQRLKSATLALNEGAASLALGMMSILFAPAVNRKSLMAQGIYHVMVHTPPVGIAGALRGMAERPDSLKTLCDASVPVAIMAGEDDQIVTPETSRQVARTIPASLVFIADAGHMPMVEQPGATTSALRTFLTSLDAR